MGKYNEQYWRDYYQKNKAQRSLKDRCRRYRITLEDIEHAFAIQKGRCAVCRELIDRSKPNSWHVDHNHKLGEGMRGILCPHCNKLLSGARDSVAILEAAIRYLDIEFVAY